MLQVSAAARNLFNQRGQGQGSTDRSAFLVYSSILFRCDFIIFIAMMGTTLKIVDPLPAT